MLWKETGTHSSKCFGILFFFPAFFIQIPEPALWGGSFFLFLCVMLLPIREGPAEKERVNSLHYWRKLQTKSFKPSLNTLKEGKRESGKPFFQGYGKICKANTWHNFILYVRRWTLTRCFSSYSMWSVPNVVPGCVYPWEPGWRSYIQKSKREKHINNLQPVFLLYLNVSNTQNK